LHETGSTVSVPHWVIWSCGLAIAAGTFIGGWRIIRTMGQGFTDLQPVQGFSAQIASSSVLFTAAHFGLPLSTTHAATGSIVGVGVAGERHKMRWNLVIDVAIAWIVTLPAAALVGALTYWLVDSLGSMAGVLVTGIVAAGICVVIMRKAREDAIDASNVNDEWGWHAEQIEQATTKETVAA
jgi:PiT family inorganic phosphate transporter